tara:strand:+ start:29 stop:505 length:477 start_codon:yes stop_codon:yes gene_type:complete
MDISKFIYRISKEIEESEIENPLLIGIPRRGDIINKKISNQLIKFDYKHQITNVNYTPFRDDLESKIPKEKMHISPVGRDVILVDDVIYTGRTMRAVTEAVMFSGRPLSVNIACLVDRGHREVPFTPKFVGKNVPTSPENHVSVLLKELDGRDEILIN